MQFQWLSRISPNGGSRNTYFKIVLALVLIILSGQLIWAYREGLGDRIVAKFTSLRPDFKSASRLQVNDVQNFHQYGTEQCFSPLAYADITERSAKMSKSCRHHSPSDQPPKAYRVGTVQALFSQNNPDRTEALSRALQTHQMHSLVQADPLFILCSPIVDGMWNKQQFILNIMYEELAKPESERLEWLFWADSDTMVLDQCRHLSDFLPPKTKGSRTTAKTAEDVHLMAAKDMNGLNAGVFFIRVSDWGIRLLNAVNSYRLYNPGVNLPFEEQTAMANLFERSEFKNNVTFVPQYWFNAYTHGERSYTTDGNLGTLEPTHARRGDFMIHFPGDPNKHNPMLRWSGWLETEGNVWETGRVERNPFPEIKDFWIKELV